MNNKDIRKTKKAYVEWVDSMCFRGWHQNDAVQKECEPSNICSIGYVVKDTKREIVLTTSLSNNGSITDPLTIPKVAITKRRNFK